ncbi:hypothetical protein BGZ81_008292, partial [Podila clonocystis]
MTALGLMASAAHAQELFDAYSKFGILGGFTDLNPLASLTVGPYPSLAEMGFSPLTPANAQGLNKRRVSCNSGYYSSCG